MFFFFLFFLFSLPFASAVADLPALVVHPGQPDFDVPVFPVREESGGAGAGGGGFSEDVAEESSEEEAVDTLESQAKGDSREIAGAVDSSPRTSENQQESKGSSLVHDSIDADRPSDLPIIALIVVALIVILLVILIVRKRKGRLPDSL
jgi:cobalamin biosynthesis Mg chelatase CobN